MAFLNVSQRVSFGTKSEGPKIEASSVSDLFVRRDWDTVTVTGRLPAIAYKRGNVLSPALAHRWSGQLQPLRYGPSTSLQMQLD
jgi:hypothetical protein